MHKAKRWNSFFEEQVVTPILNLRWGSKNSNTTISKNVNFQIRFNRDG